MTVAELAKDPTVAGCLSRLRRGEYAAAGVLADYLEEHGLPHAKKVRALWDKVAFWGRIVAARPPEVQARRKHAKWERIAGHRAYLRNGIARLFGRTWKPLELTKYL